MTEDDSSPGSSRMSPDADEWRSALDAFTAGLEAHRTLVETGETTGPAPWPPPTLPNSPLPEEFRQEAELLLRAAGELSEAMGRQLAGLPMRRMRSRHAKSTGGARWKTVL